MTDKHFLEAFKDWRVLAMIAAIVIAVVTAREWYYKNPSLTGQSTAYEYLASSIEQKLDWREAMCRNGVCLTLKDWKCGWWPVRDGESSWESAVERCFDVIVEKAKPHDRLHKLRQICGRRYMTFQGSRESDITQENCAKIGGRWGEKLKVWVGEDDDDKYRDK